MTPVLRELHWLPVRQRIRFKTAVMVYKCTHGLAPSYLAAHCKPTSSCPGRSHMRSATSGQLNFPRTKIDYGKRSFAVNGPVLLSGTAYLLNFGHLTSRWMFSKPNWRHFCLTADLAHLVYFILSLRSTNDLNNNNNNNNNLLVDGDPTVQRGRHPGHLCPRIAWGRVLAVRGLLLLCC